MKCEDIQKELSAFLTDDLDDQKKTEVQEHIDQCSNCSKDLEQVERLSKILHAWKGVEPSAYLYKRLESRIEQDESFWGKVFTYSFIKKAGFRFAEVVVVVGLTLIISHLLQKPAPVAGDDIDTINLYLAEHQGAVLKNVSEEISLQTEARISVRPENFFYYEYIDGFPRYTRPGVVLKGPSKSQGEIPVPEVPSISKGEILDLPQARKAVDFEPVSPVRLHPGYILDSIRKIEDYNSLHLIYTNGINTLSLFEQSLDGQQGLAAQDFREYAVYRNIEPDKAQVTVPDKATILAWRNGSVSFVLIGKEDMSRLMEIAQAVSTVNKENHGFHE
ncbi:MAG: zf-HC2 domain-containing protein [Candidatus Aminicenantes bacterium]|nr:zf-HC2 domain-containing protein [Candidatus Aminicenantes bacterium]MDH5385744.1 zf-HC2 domain-containing protein [Candidatus Aminicenantes bacterium]MDH5745190.1 zf-HC2 domain-containing protein [Candidatus Aminicenantes bacterium]